LSSENYFFRRSAQRVTQGSAESPILRKLTLASTFILLEEEDAPVYSFPGVWCAKGEGGRGVVSLVGSDWSRHLGSPYINRSLPPLSPHLKYHVFSLEVLDRPSGPKARPKPPENWQTTSRVLREIFRATLNLLPLLTMSSTGSEDKRSLTSQISFPFGLEDLLKSDFLLFEQSECRCIEILAVDSIANCHVTARGAAPRETSCFIPAEQQKESKASTSADNSQEIAPNGSLAIGKVDIKPCHERTQLQAKRVPEKLSGSSKGSGNVARGNTPKGRTKPTSPPKAPLLSRLLTPELSDLEGEELCACC
jgi:hypothetical protein